MMRKYIGGLLSFICCVLMAGAARAGDNGDPRALAEEIARLIDARRAEGGEFLLHIGDGGTTLYRIDPVGPETEAAQPDGLPSAQGAAAQPAQPDTGRRTVYYHPRPRVQQEQTAPQDPALSQGQAMPGTQDPALQQGQAMPPPLTFSNAYVVVYQAAPQGDPPAQPGQPAQAGPPTQPDLTAQPDTATHGDAVALLMNMAALTPEGEPLSADSAAYWARHTQTAAAHGLIAPDTDGAFDPQRPLTWGALSVYLNRVFQLPDDAARGGREPQRLVSKDELSRIGDRLQGITLKNLRALPYQG